MSIASIRQTEHSQHRPPRASTRVENEILLGTKKKRNGQRINPPQPPRDELPNPAESPDEFDHIITEVGSGSGTFALAVYHTDKGKVGVYTTDWDDDRFAHLKQDLRFLNFSSLLKIFPKLRHVHFTWDCKSNSPGDFDLDTMS